MNLHKSFLRGNQIGVQIQKRSSSSQHETHMHHLKSSKTLIVRKTKFAQVVLKRNINFSFHFIIEHLCLELRFQSFKSNTTQGELDLLNIKVDKNI